MSEIQYHILNLSFREDRKYAQLGALALMGYPIDDIIFHEAPSGYEYENADAVCQAAAEDGFPGFLPCHDNSAKMRYGFAYLWGTLQIMRKIIDGEAPYGYFNQDDNFLRVVPEQIQQDIAELKNLKIAQLSWFREESEAGPKVSDNYYEGSHVYGDSGMIVSKEGAQLIVNEFQKETPWLEHLICKLSKKHDGIYCIVDKHSRILRLPEYFFKYKEDGITSENLGTGPILVDKNT